LEIVVPPSLYPVSYKGEYHMRSGSTRQELKNAALESPAAIGNAATEASVKTSVKTSVALLALLRENPDMTLAEAAAVIGRSVRAIEMASAKLVKTGKLKYVGPQKGGHWEVVG
jgi:ATP-dependent DNA helicase RecG